MGDKVEFKYIGFGIYTLIRNSFIFRPEAFKMLSSKGVSYNRIAFNLWVKR